METEQAAPRGAGALGPSSSGLLYNGWRRMIFANPPIIDPFSIQTLRYFIAMISSGSFAMLLASRRAASRER